MSTLLTVIIALSFVGLAVLSGLFVLSQYQQWRRAKDRSIQEAQLRIREAQLRKFCITPDIKGTRSIHKETR